MLQALTDSVFTDHARDEMARRGISESVVRGVLAQPNEVRSIRPGRVVAQARRSFGDSDRTYLVRVFVDVDREPPEVVTVYRTSKIGKYLQQT